MKKFYYEMVGFSGICGVYGSLQRYGRYGARTSW